MDEKTASADFKKFLAENAKSLHAFDRYVTVLGPKAYAFAMREFSAVSAEVLEQRIVAAPPSDDNLIPNLLKAYAVNGRNTIKLSDEIVAMFDRTDLNRQRCIDVPDAPFKCMYFDVRNMRIPAVSVVDLQPILVDGVFVYDCKTEEYNEDLGEPEKLRHIVIAMWTRERVNGAETPASEFNEWDREFVEKVQSTAPKKLVQEYNDSHTVYHFVMPQEDEDMLEGYMKYLSVRYMATKALPGENYDERRTLVVAGMNQFMHMYYNTLMFISLGDGADVVKDQYTKQRKVLNKLISEGTKGDKPTASAKASYKQIIKYGASTVTLVGGSFKKTAGQTGSSSSGSVGSEESKVRAHWVRGHWRNQPVGPRAEGGRKLMWIKPHKKGSPDKGEVTSRTYEVK